MHEPNASAGQFATDEDQAIRDQVRAVTNQVLQQGWVDPEALRNVVRTLAGNEPAMRSLAVRRLENASLMRWGASTRRSRNPPPRRMKLSSGLRPGGRITPTMT